MRKRLATGHLGDYVSAKSALNVVLLSDDQESRKMALWLQETVVNTIELCPAFAAFGLRLEYDPQKGRLGRGPSPAVDLDA